MFGIRQRVGPSQGQRGPPHGDQERAGRMGTDAVGEGGGGTDVEVVLCLFQIY